MKGCGNWGGNRRNGERGGWICWKRRERGKRWEGRKGRGKKVWGNDWGKGDDEMEEWNNEGDLKKVVGFEVGDWDWKRE